jgi:MFS family permease
MVFISLTTRLPDFQHQWRLSPGTLSVILLMMVLLAGVGSVLAETLAARRESAWILRAGLAMIAVAEPLVVLAPSLAVFVLALALYGVALGVVDATTNMQAVALEHAYRRPILPSFHGAWTLGGIIGSALTLATAHIDLEWAALLGLVPLIALSLPLLRRGAGTPDTSEMPPVPWRPILLVGVVMVLFYMVDTASTTWGPTYLDKIFPTPSGLVALATFPYLIASGLLRLFGDSLVARHGPVKVLRVGAVLAFIALGIVVVAPTWQLAVVGFTLVGAGASVIAPLSFSAAARIAGGDDVPEELRLRRVDAVIARINQFNYVGALFGSVMTGAVGAGSLRIGFALPMVLVLGIIPLAGAFAARAHPGAAPRMAGAADAGS